MNLRVFFNVVQQTKFAYPKLNWQGDRLRVQRDEPGYGSRRVAGRDSKPRDLSLPKTKWFYGGMGAEWSVNAVTRCHSEKEIEEKRRNAHQAKMGSEIRHMQNVFRQSHRSRHPGAEAGFRISRGSAHSTTYRVTS